MNEEDLAVVEKMKAYGGSFVRALAECCYKADALNLIKIKNTWSEYWAQYKKMAGV